MSALPSAAEEVTVARRPTLDRPASAGLAREELSRFIRTLDGLSAADGARPTCCVPWDVRAMASHVLGMTQMFSSYARMARQHLPAARAVKAGAVYIDALTAHQVAGRTGLDLPTIRQQLAAAAPRNVRWRRRSPGLLRNQQMSDGQPVNGAPDAAVEPWTFGYLFDTILTRDTWMHRGDIAAATGGDLELSADHDGVIVAEVVAEWATRHDQPYGLTLTGPAGGSWSRGQGGESLELDAVEFCRVLSGRGPATGLLAVGVPF
jgi:uncharacterized protein (TIGR03083 family)